MKDGSRDEMMAAYMAYTKDMKEAGVLRAGDALEPTSTATTVRLRQGKTLVTDGPFAETKEQFGGYYLIECKDIDEATKWAAKCPIGERRLDRGPPGDGLPAALTARWAIGGGG